MPESYTAKGTLHAIFDSEPRGKFTTRKFVLEIPGYKDRKEYPSFELFGDKCDMLDNFREGDPVEVGFDLKGREHKDRWFVTLSAWKVVRDGNEAPRQEPRRSAPDRNFSRPPEQPSPTAGSAYSRKGSYVPPADDGDGEMDF